MNSQMAGTEIAADNLNSKLERLLEHGRSLNDRVRGLKIRIQGSSPTVDRDERLDKVTKTLEVSAITTCDLIQTEMIYLSGEIDILIKRVG